VNFKYYVIDEFGDKMRMFYTRNEAKYYVSNKPGWKAVKLPDKPPVDWDNYEPCLF